MRRWLAKWIYPETEAELMKFREVSAKLVQENSRLLDRLQPSKAEASIAKQLQASIERRSRMVTRLEKLQKLQVDRPELYIGQDFIPSIIKDEEPTWPPA